MPSEEQTQNTQTSSTIVQPTAPAAPASATDSSATPISDDIKRSLVSVKNEVRARIAEANNILIALSSDPSVDDLAAAIGFSLYLDRIGKRATAIYSGITPNALEFLKPEETFEDTADTLKDFVIALNKEKADHLRYKLDGDFVKIFITPYKKLISEPDLDFSYGDYNVDLVLAIDVNNGVDLDSALREYGRIMHDAAVINITTGNPGKFGEIEWSDKTSSSVSEMISDLLYSDENAVPLEKEEATAMLTGIVAATNRFSKANTTPETMQIASKLMESGADQQLIAKNITSDVSDDLNKKEGDGNDEELDLREDMAAANVVAPNAEAANELTIEHEDEEETTTEAPTELSAVEELPSEEAAAPAPTDAPIIPEAPNTENPDQALLADLKAAEATLAGVAAEATPEVNDQPVRVETSSESGSEEKVIAPSNDFLTDVADKGSNKFSEMLEEALEESADTPIAAPEMTATALPEPTIAMEAPVAQPVAQIPVSEPISAPEPVPAPVPMSIDENPALSAVPSVPSAPEINGVPEMNFNASMDELLPPPPVPPVDMSNPLPTPELNMAPSPVMPEGPAAMEAPVEPAAPAEQPAPATQPVNASSAFQIPGM